MVAHVGLRERAERDVRLPADAVAPFENARALAGLDVPGLVLVHGVQNGTAPARQSGRRCHHGSPQAASDDYEPHATPVSALPPHDHDALHDEVDLRGLLRLLTVRSRVAVRGSARLTRREPRPPVQNGIPSLFVRVQDRRHGTLLVFKANAPGTASATRAARL